MGSLSVLVLLLVAISSVQSQEPKCYSTFDFQEKLLEKMVALSHSVDTMEKQFAKKMEELTALSEKLKEDRIAMEAKFDAKFGRLSVDLYTLANTTLKELQDSIKPNVAFLVRTVSNMAPGTNQQLIFTTAILNTDNSYSTDTGEFTAPVGGTYWFSVQICLYNKKSINIRIYVNDTVMSDSIQYDADGGYPCTTFNTVAILTKGDRVYVKSGPNSSSGTIILQDNHRWGMFMGSLIN